MKVRDQLLRLLAAAALAVGPIAKPAIGVAAPPSPKSQAFDAPYRKTLEEYDRSAGTGAGRSPFERGLKALDAGDFNGARSDFDASAAAVPSYEAAFNAALSAQLAHRYGDAAAGYEKARQSDRRDPELETNLALALADAGKRGDSLKRLEAGLAIADDEDVKGRILYQRSLVQFKLGQPLDAYNSINAADAAFAASGDTHGQAVAAARRGALLFAMGGDGGPPLREAVGELQKIDAFVDESQARLMLAGYDVEAGDAEEAGPQFARAVAAADASGNAQQLGQSLYDSALYQLHQRQKDLAGKDYEAAIAAFRNARDRIGEGQANEDLCRLDLSSGDLDPGFDRCARAVRVYRGAWSGPGRAISAATLFADLFRQSGQEPRQKYFLDVGQWLLGKSPPSIAKANVLVGLARYNINHDLDAAEADAKEAHETYLAQGDAKSAAIAELVLERVQDARNQRLQESFFGLAFISFLVWPIIWIRAELWRVTRASGRFVAAPFRWTAAGLRRLDTRWTGTPLADADEETRRFDRFRVRLVGAFCAAAIALFVAYDAMTVTGPNLRYISEIGETVTTEGEVLPPDLIDSIQRLLDRDSNYVLLAVLVQIAILAVGLVASLFVFGFLESFIFGLIDRFLRRARPPIDAAVRARAVEALRTLQRRLGVTWIVVSIATLAIATLWQPPLHLVGQVLLGMLLVVEVVFCASISRALGVLPADARTSAYNYLSRIGLHHVCTVTLGIIGALYILMPRFYAFANLAQQRLVLPTFDAVQTAFYSTMVAASRTSRSPTSLTRAPPTSGGTCCLACCSTPLACGPFCS
jgi:hypothetical protein